MSRHTLPLKKPNEWYRLNVDAENPFINLIRIEFDPLEAGKSYPAPKIIIRITHFSGGESIHPIHLSRVEKDSTFKINFRGNLEDFKMLEFMFDDSNKEDLKNAHEYQNLRLVYEIIELLDSSIPTNGFEEHLRDPRNIKILFSAPFGKGKSTFLDYFFEERKNKYHVFKIHPVNYAVAKNEDVFTYIKCEILIQLLNSGIEFEKKNTSKKKAFGDFFKKNAHKLFAPLLLISPSLGQNMYMMFEKFDALKDEFIDYHEKLQTDEKILSQEYFENFMNKEGGIFEDNFITFLIRKYINRIKEAEKKEAILLIDDLDRMDPDHIFRILNVFSAHYDSYKFRREDEHNKFDFDRIILVADYENLHNIYAYRYGPESNFEGYINKYYSTKKFDYYNDKINLSIIHNIDNQKNTEGLLTNPLYQKFILVTSALLNAGQVTLRELIKLQSIKLHPMKRHLHSGGLHSFEYFKYGSYSPTIMLLSNLGSNQSLVKKLEAVNEEHMPQEVKYEREFLILHGALRRKASGTIIKHENNRTLKYNLIIDSRFDLTDCPERAEIYDDATKQLSKSQYRREFDFNDWKKHLIENVRFYSKIKDQI